MSTKYYVANVPEEEQLYAEWRLSLHINHRYLRGMTEAQYKMWFPWASLSFEDCQQKIWTDKHIPIKELLREGEWRRLWEGRELYALLWEKTPMYIGEAIRFPVEYDISCELEGEPRDLNWFPNYVSLEILESIIDNYQETGRIPLIRISEWDIAYDSQTDGDSEYLFAELTENAKDTWMKPFIDGSHNLKSFYEEYFDENGPKPIEEAGDILANPLIYDVCVELMKKNYEEVTEDCMKPVMDKLRPFFLEWLENDYRAHFPKDSSPDSAQTDDGVVMTDKKAYPNL